MTKLTDTFRIPESRTRKTIVAVDLTESTRMKEAQPEAAWLTTYGWFYDLLTETMARYKGQIVKYLGDGLMAVFAEDDATDGINWAIVVQEEMASGRARNLVNCGCSVGISTGEVVEFDSPTGGKDYIGQVADRAFRLCSAANVNAIFVDRDTVAAARMTRLASKAGHSVASRRTPAEYQGPEESIRLKGFSQPVTYHEILWENSRFSVKPTVATELSARVARGVDEHRKHPARLPPTQPAQGATTPWSKGRVTSMNDSFGFVAGPDGEDFWFNPDQLLSRTEIPRINDEVWFVPADPLPGKRSRRATDIVALGAALVGTLERVMPQGYGFVIVNNQRGDSRQIFLSLGGAGAFNPGAQVEFIVGANQKGIAGYDPRVLDSTNTTSE